MGREIDLPPNQATDLATLWEKAVNDYARSTKTDISQMQARSIDDIMNTAMDKKESFDRFRHKGEKSDKLRGILGNHLGGMQKCLDGISMVGSAAAVFPPAMPVTIVFAACSRVLGAFAGVKADFEQIEEFLSLSSRFFERLSIIEGTNCGNGPLGTAIVRVFSAQLAVYAIVQDMMSRKGVRIKKFFEALWDPQDPRLTAGFGAMQASIDELAKTVGFASYAAIRSTQDVTIHINEKTDKLDESIREWREQQSEDIFKIFESNLEMTMEIRMVGNEVHRTQSMLLESFASMRLQHESFRAQQDKANAAMLKAMEREKSRPDQEGMDKRKQATGKGDVGSKRFKAVRSIKAYFNNNENDFRNWSDAYRESAAEHADIQEAFVNGTGDWLVKNTDFNDWIDGTKRLLWLKGADGIGKSFLSFAATQQLLARQSGNAVAYFYFKEDYPCLQSVQNAIACACLQVAERHPAYAKHIAKVLDENEDQEIATTSWQRLFLSVFNDPTDGSDKEFSAINKLYLIFDGLDEMPEEQLQIFKQFLTDLKSMGSRVQLLVTSRPQEISLEPYEPLIIDVTKGKMLRDIKALVWNRLNSGLFRRLKKFSLTAKKIIRRKISKQADGMLYVDHMIRRLSYIGREGAVLKDLEKMPADLHELYKYMLNDCRRNRSVEQYEALKKLFAWLAFSKRPLSLAEASELVAMTITEDHLDIEDEIIGRSARILELSRLSRLGEDHHEDVKEDENEGQDDEPDADLDDYRTAPLAFQERSLRQYFRALSVEQHDGEELRTPASTAQLTILTMCIEVLMKSATLSGEEKAPELRDYAVKYWYEHFNELDVDAATDSETAQVLAALHSILMNHNNVSKVFDHFAKFQQLYPEKKDDEPEPWHGRLQPWMAKAETLSAPNINEEVKLWASALSEDPKSALIPLAKGHIDNWFTSWKKDNIIACYMHAKSVLTICGKLDDPPLDPWEKVVFMSKMFDDTRKDAQTLRAIGVRSYWAVFAGLDEARTNEIKTAARSYLTESTAMMEVGSAERAANLLHIANMHWWTNKDAKSIELLDEALEAREVSDKAAPTKSVNTKEFPVWSLYQVKADRLKELEKKADAVQAYATVRKLCQEDPQSAAYGANFLEEIIMLLDDLREDGQIMEFISSCTEKERHLWFNYNLEYYCDIEAMERLYRAAKTTGQTDLVLEWLHTYRKTLKPHSFLILNLEAALADLYEKVLGDIDKAKAAMQTALQVEPKIDHTWEEEMVHELVSTVRLDLAGIIFTQFRSSADPSRKQALIEEMKNLPGTREGDNFQESHIGMLMANMLRIMGPTRDYQNYMDQIFKTCTEGLEDDDFWNDSHSLRLLAKLLSSLEGLQRDARITISSQFSILDKNVYENAQSSESGDEGEESEDESKAASDKEESGGDPDPKVQDELEKPDSTQEVTSSAQDAVGDSSKPSEVKASDTPSEETTPNVDATTNIEGEADKEETQEEEENDEDLAGWDIACDGCDTGIDQWSAPFYLCLICPNTDLCASCHDKRVASEDSDPNTSWRMFCAPDHCYIKGPMKGWQGIKDGVIRIEGEEPITVKDWIKGLKSERWPKAWERYWLKQGALKDIGDED